MVGLSNRNFYLAILEAERSKIKVPANSVPGESSSPGTNGEHTWQKESKRSGLSSSYNPISLNQITSQSSNTISLGAVGVGVQHMNFEGT